MSSAKGISLAPDAAAGPARIYCELDGLPMPVDERSLSLAGVFLTTPTPPPVDTEVQLFLRHGESQACLEGLVVKSVSCEDATTHGGRPGCGVLFTNLTAQARAFLNAVVATVSGQNDGVAAPTGSKQARRADRKKRTIPLQAAPLRLETSGPRPKAPTPARRQVTAAFERTVEPQGLLAMRRRMRAELERQASYAPHRVLGVAAGASDAVARTAYLKLSKQYHPHRYARHDDEELNALVTQVFIGYKRAYRAFVRERRRA